MKFIKKHWVAIWTVIVVALFGWLRFANIGSAFIFTGDPGRDMLTLWEWRETGKIPLLGPQTSAMPINQSAVYFYMLYPAFLITGGDPISANITVAFFWIASLLWGLWALRNRQELQKVVLIVFTLAAIFPLFVTQTRSVWNPSFLPPLITIAIISLFLMEEKYTGKRLLVFSTSTALAVSLHFPVATFALAGLMYAFVFFRKYRLMIALSLISSLIIFNLPTLAFETRHGFMITRSMLEGHWLGTAQYTRIENLDLLVKYVGGVGVWWANILILVGSGTYAVTETLRRGKSLMRVVSLMFFISLTLTILSGMAFHSHYAYGFVVTIFLIVSQLPPRLLLPTLFTLGVIWLNPTQISDYFKPARRSMSEMNKCFQMICKTEKEPIFVSVQSEFHPFHVGYEYRYLMKRNGCDVRSIETEPNSASTMAVVLDGSEYEQDKTSFNELTLFGKSYISHRYDCGNHFRVVILSNKLKLVAPMEIPGDQNVRNGR